MPNEARAVEQHAVVVQIANHPDYAPHRSEERDERARMALCVMGARGDRLWELRAMMIAAGMI